MTDGITLVMGDDGAFREMPEPYMTIAVDTEEDWKALQDAMSRVNQMRWISVKDRLPDKGAEYLCRCCIGDTDEYPFYMVLQYYLLYQNPHFQHECDPGLRVTHWMPLPEPPKEEA